MVWWWFKKKEKLPPAPPPQITHDELACEFFQMPIQHQIDFLHYYLGVDNAEATLAAAQPDFNDVILRLDATEGAPSFTSYEFIRRVKSIIDDGRKYAVEAAFGNIFRDNREACFYADVIAKCTIEELES